MSERRLLALSYAFPPIALPEAALSAKRLANLPGWKADVIAAARFHRKIGNDPDLVGYAEAHVASVTRLTPVFPALWPVMNRIGRAPDVFRFLNGKVVRAARALGIEKFSALLSWSQYHSIHLAAHRIKLNHPHLPWVAHFSDPWVDNPFNNLQGRGLKINRALERDVIESADRVLFTTPETLDLMMEKYPPAWRNKARVIPHGFEPALYPVDDAVPTKPQRTILRYLGNFYGQRTPEPLYRALAAAFAQRPTLVGKIAVEIVGGFEKGMHQLPHASILPVGLVSIYPPVGYRQSLRLMRSSDILLVIDAPGDSSVFLPSKLVDYLGAGKPIVGITPPGASARVLRDTGNFVADPRDPQAGARALLAALDRGVDTSPAADQVQRYSAISTGAELAAVLDELVY